MKFDGVNLFKMYKFILYDVYLILKPMYNAFNINVLEKSF